MTLLIAGMVLFYAIHLVAFTPLGPTLRQRLGEAVYKGLFSALSLLGMVVMIWGFIRTGSGPDAARIVFHPPGWGYHAVMPLVLLALTALVASGFKGRIKLWLKHPMSVGVALWATGHLLVNGSLGEVLFFGGFLGLSLVDIIVNTLRGKVPAYRPKAMHDVLSVVIAAMAFLAAGWLHPVLIGVSVV